MTSQQLSRYLEVENYVKEHIESGAFAPGTKLPSTRALAKQFETSVFTVQTALTRLHNEGLILRREKFSTYVRGEKPALTCVAVYYNHPLDGTYSLFQQTLLADLRKKLSDRNIDIKIFSDDRPDIEHDEIPRSLKRAIEKREVQALIAPLICALSLQWLEKLSIPAAIVTSNIPSQNRVSSDGLQLLRKGVKKLRDQGCRTIGFIHNIPFCPQAHTSLDWSFYKNLINVVSDMGMETRNEWLRFPLQNVPFLSQYGYEQFHQLWKQDTHPEGLVVFPDMSVPGVIAAIQELDVRVPEQLRVVFHANDQIPYPCPLPASFLVTKIGEYATALTTTIIKQIEGQAPTPTSIPFHLVEGTNPFSIPTNS